MGHFGFRFSREARAHHHSEPSPTNGDHSLAQDSNQAVRTIEHATIPLSDGTRLSARIWLPADAETNAVPAILEYIPYRKRDFTRTRDETLHRYFA